jgi:hypothetical protein
MAGTAVAILTPRARRANASRWVEAKERGGTPHANIPKETPIDAGTHPTCPADVLPNPYRSNRSGSISPGNPPTPLVSGQAGARLLKHAGIRGRRLCEGWSERRARRNALHASGAHDGMRYTHPVQRRPEEAYPRTRTVTAYEPPRDAPTFIKPMAPLRKQRSSRKRNQTERPEQQALDYSIVNCRNLTLFYLLRDTEIGISSFTTLDPPLPGSTLPRLRLPA